MRIAFRSRAYAPRVVHRRAGDDPLVIRGGRIVDASGTSARLDILIDSLTIEDLAASIETRGGVIDAAGLIVLPGLIHPWFDPASNQIPSSSFELAYQLRAALHFGVTTVHLPKVSENQGRALRQAIAEEIFDGPRILLSRSIRDLRSVESPLTELRRSIGFGVDLLVTDGQAHELELIARSVAEMARRPLIEEAVIQAATARIAGQFERLRSETSSDRFWTNLAQESLASADALGMGDTMGSIEVGKLADITIVDADADGWRPVLVLTASSN